MLVLSEQLKELNVISLRLGHMVAKTLEPIIEPAKLEILAFRLEAPAEEHAKPILMCQDIRQIAGGNAVIDDAEEITELSEIIRLSDIADFRLIGLPVVTESDQKLGRVADYTVELDSFKIRKLMVRPPFPRNIFAGELIIDRQQIVYVDHKRVVVRDADIEAGAKIPVAQTELDLAP